MQRTLNVNVGILGHIDSGKTSLAKALSSHASTAAFDKSPQSQERGITLDLGFSSFVVERSPFPEYDRVQFTLVDCPGHASLIRTIIGGAQTIDAVLLVVDAAKGVQTQTAEGVVIGSLATRRLVAALNKTDALPTPDALAKSSQRLARVLASTPFAGAAIVPVAAAPRGQSEAPRGIDELRSALYALVGPDMLAQRQRGAQEPFLMAVDHCFSVRGQGTVVTGTVLRGSVAVGDSVEIAEVRAAFKVKSMQVFHKPVQAARIGDRVGLCLPQLDAKAFERGVAAMPGTVPTVAAAVGLAARIPYFKGQCASKQKFHVTVGHTTAMATVTFFASTAEGETPFSRQAEYEYVPEMVATAPAATAAATAADAAAPEAGDGSAAQAQRRMWVLLEFEQPITCPHNALFIASHLDTDINKNTCRLAFSGNVADLFETAEGARSVLRVFRRKAREGVVERVTEQRGAIGRGLFKKEAAPELWTGLKVTLPEHGGMRATIEGAFGKSGKFKLALSADAPPTLAGAKIRLDYKSYLFHKSAAFVQ
eukprot:m51a1_g9088 putative selenocysteine-specific elongation factor (538) ;mRNA; r:43311-45327